MSKIYKVDMKINVEKLTPHSGIMMKEVPKEADPKDAKIEFDPRGFKERSGAEVFALICKAAINNANPKVSHQQLQAFRKVTDDVDRATSNGEFIGNKTDLDIIKNSIQGNRNWPNNEETLIILDQVVNNLNGAALIDENPTAPADPPAK